MKRQTYGKFRVREYWLVDYEARTIEIYVLKRGILELRSTLREKDELTSTVLVGFSCKVSDIFQ